jgi:hypothetical protein
MRLVQKYVVSYSVKVEAGQKNHEISLTFPLPVQKQRTADFIELHT